MTDAHAQRRLEIVLIVAAAVAWSTAPFFTRLLSYDSWTILFWRGVFATALITLFLAATEGRAGMRAFQEVPTARALVGGALVLGAVVADIVGDNRERARQRVTSPSSPSSTAG